MKLSESQRRIVEHTGHIVAAAPPGSGKTRVIVERTKRLLESQKGSIKLVTFTRAAAQEMKSRVGKASRGRVEAATFDSYCYRMAKQAGNALTPPNALSDYIAKRKTCAELVLKGDALDELIAPASTKLVPKKAPRESYEAYQLYLKFLEHSGHTDFASIARNVVMSLSEGGKIRPLEVAHLMVDEFQDADEIQLAWVLGHAKLAKSIVMVVGDDDQSIYGWRGGLGYQAMKKIQSRLNAELIMLDQCFRCRPEIVEHARVLIAKNRARFHKPVLAPRAMGGVVRHMMCLNEESASRYILETVESLGSPRFALLGRRNADLDKYNAFLTAAGVDVARIGGKSFWRAAGATAILELLSVIIDRSYEKGLNAVLSYMSVDHNDDEAVRRSIQQGFIASDQEGVIIDKHKKNLAEIVLSAGNIRDRGVQHKVMRDVVNLVRDNEKSGWREYKAASTAVDVIQKGLLENDGSDLVNMVTSLKAKMERKQSQANEANAQATLCTMHASKGKEWPAVFVVNANEGITPNQRGDPEENPITEVEVEEERRLFYVALTRAEDSLFVISTDSIGKKQGFVPSRFIKEAAIKVVGEEDQPPEDNRKKERSTEFVEALLSRSS